MCQNLDPKNIMKFQKITIRSNNRIKKTPTEN